jgi:AcrR family transcriptional regulator
MYLESPMKDLRSKSKESKMPEKRLTARKIQAKESRQKIFDTAVELFEKKGYENVTIEEICKKAGFSTGNFYVHFKSKDQIFMEIFMDIDEYFMEVIEGLATEKDVVERLRLFMVAAMKHLSDLGSHFLRVIYYTQIAPDKGKSYIDSEKRPLYAIVHSMIEEGQEKGEISKRIESHEIARLLVIFYRGLLYDWCLKNGSFDLLQASEEIYSIFSDGFRAV